MITISIDPIIFSIGHFMIRWYSVIVLVAILVGIGSPHAKRHAKDSRRKMFTMARCGLCWAA